MIELNHLTKSFGQFIAVNDISFKINDGETFALLGPNGSGKTTTLKCMVGLTVPTAGEIKINGLDLWRDAREARRMMSFLPQRLSFHESLTAREVLEFYRDLRKLPAAKIDDVLHNSHFDFNGFCHKPVGELSGGMVQRLGLAVACLPDAPVLLLDEPTVSLDPEGAIRFREFLATLKSEGKTIVFSSHVLADVERLADRVAILVNGRLVAIESIAALREELMRSCRMRIVLANPNAQWIEAAREAGACEALLQGDAMLVTSRAEDRMKILRAIETAGGSVARFATEELSLEDIYLNYIHAESTENK
ncbi:MAG: ABC transporter ATP-binding protein [Acidobacteria bacterium]|nr:ABC transporter ATP-binding protein [Acidobacteriota bacterium]